MHVPPFKHGDDSHSLNSYSQFSPAKPKTNYNLSKIDWHTQIFNDVGFLETFQIFYFLKLQPMGFERKRNLAGKGSDKTEMKTLKKVNEITWTTEAFVSVRLRNAYSVFTGWFRTKIRRVLASVPGISGRTFASEFRLICRTFAAIFARWRLARICSFLASFSRKT